MTDILVIKPGTDRNFQRMDQNGQKRKHHSRYDPTAADMAFEISYKMCEENQK